MLFSLILVKVFLKCQILVRARQAKVFEAKVFFLFFLAQLASLMATWGISWISKGLGSQGWGYPLCQDGLGWGRWVAQATQDLVTSATITFEGLNAAAKNASFSEKYRERSMKKGCHRLIY